MTVRRAVAAAALLVAATCTRKPAERFFVLATTTTVQGSGVLPMLQSEFKHDTGIEIRALVAGSGQALKLAERNQADVAITHDPVAEKAFVSRTGPSLYRQFMWNEFVIVGPPSDPAGIASSASAPEAFSRIARSGSRFTSRNDQSGTHTKERAIWRAAGIVPEANPAYRKMGQPMPALLRSSSELQAYTLSDRATFEQLQPNLQLRLLYAGDPVLRNVYSIILVRGREDTESANARRFVDWLLNGRGRSLLSAYKIKGRTAFHMM